MLLFGAAAIAAPVLPLPHPDVIDTRNRLVAPLTLADHALGTDELGRDMFSRLVRGARISLLMGIASAVGALTVGGLLGLVSGYRGGSSTR